MIRWPRLRLTSADDWRGATTLAFYRCAVALGLLALVGLSAPASWQVPGAPTTYRWIALVYLGLTGIQAGLALVRRPDHVRHVFGQIGVDIAALAVVGHLAGGMDGGLPMLLIPSLAAGGVMLSTTTSFALAGLAAAAILGQEILHAARPGHGDTDVLQIGLLCLLYLLTTALAAHLTQRLAASNAAAANLADRSRDLARINRHIIDHMQIGALVIDADDRVQTWNQAARNLLGQNETDIDGRRVAEVLPELAALIARWRETGAAPPLLSVGDRRLLPGLQSLGEPERGATTLVFLEDIQRAGEQAQQIKLVSLGRLSASIAHEIRNPLAAISHAAQLLAESEQRPPEDERLVSIVLHHSRRIDRLVESVLGLARRSERHAQRLQLGEWLAEAVADYRAMRHDPPHIVVEDLAPDAEVIFDDGQLRQVLGNIWDNSDRHARKSAAPHITVTISRDAQRRCLLTITDDGPGIEAALMDRVLEPFFTTANEGTGLGLHLAAEICETNGARLAPVDSDAGACFRILFSSPYRHAMEVVSSCQPQRHTP